MGLSVRPASRPVKPYVPRDEPTQTSRRSRTPVETAAPEDPEALLARMERSRRRRRAGVMAMALAALLVGLAVLLDRGLLEIPSGAQASNDLVLPEVPADLKNTWVAKALEEARSGEAKESPGAMRPLARQAPKAQQAAGPEDSAQAQQAETATAAQPAVATATPATATARAPAAAVARREPSGRSRARAAVRERAPDTRDDRGAMEAGTTSPAPAVVARKSGSPVPTPAEPAEGVEIIAAHAGVVSGSGGVEIAAAEDPGVEDEGFYEEVDVAFDPERFRPRRPWPTPTGRPPAGGHVGTVSLITLPSAEVRFRDHALGSTPLHHQQLPSGRQRLILIGPDGVRRVLIVDVHGDDHAELQLPITRLMPEALMLGGE